MIENDVLHRVSTELSLLNPRDPALSSASGSSAPSGSSQVFGADSFWGTQWPAGHRCWHRHHPWQRSRILVNKAHQWRIASLLPIDLLHRCPLLFEATCSKNPRFHQKPSLVCVSSQTTGVKKRTSSSLHEPVYRVDKPQTTYTHAPTTGISHLTSL